LDSVQFVYPSFFEWCGNEKVREREVYGKVGGWSEWLEERGRRDKKGEGGREGEQGEGAGEEEGEDGGVRVDGVSDEEW
jgi:hypothetical protein